ASSAPAGRAAGGAGGALPARSSRSSSGSACTAAWAWVARATSRELSADATRGDSNSLPAGLLVAGGRPALERAFGALAPLQPLEWTAAGLVCAPRAAPEIAAAALAACPFPPRPAPPPTGPPPRPPAGHAAPADPPPPPPRPPP